MVTWGQNQVFTVPGNNPAGAPTGGVPAPPTLGSPSPAPGSLFGATPAPAPGTSLFGSTAATPAPGTSLFGSTAPAPATGSLFGASTPAPAPFTSFFGSSSPAPAPGLFGAAAPSPGGLFGTTAATPPPSQFANAIPAQAALQAHLDASVRQEAAKFQAALEKLHQAYSGTSEKDSFVTIVYNNMTSEQLQWQFVQSQSGGGPAIPPKPQQVSEKRWLEAVVRNPDSKMYIPAAMIGAEALQARLGWQQDRSQQLARGVEQLQHAHQALADQTERYKQSLVILQRTHAALRKRLLELMAKVELVRCMNIQLQPDEIKLTQRLAGLVKQVDDVNKLMVTIQNKSIPIMQQHSMDVPNREALFQIFQGQRQGLVQLSTVVQKDRRDVKLLQERLPKQAPTLTR